MRKLTFLLIICSFFAATSVFGQILGTKNYGNFDVNPSSSNNVSIGGFQGKYGVVDYVNPNYRLHITGYTGTNNLNGIFIDAYGKTGLYSKVTTGTAIWAQSTTGLAGLFNGMTRFNGNTVFDGNAQFLATVGIGTSTPQKKLHVQNGDILIQNGRLLLSNGQNQIELKSDGLIHAREIEVDLDVIPDYVFEDDYDLMPLTELQKFIDLNHYLPNIKSAAEYETYGSIPLKELNLKLLEKVEELTLYTLKQEKEIEALKAANAEIESLKKQMAEMQVLLKKMTNK